MLGGVLRFLWDWVSGEIPTWDYGQTLAFSDHTFRAAGITDEAFAMAGADGDAFRSAGITGEAFIAAGADGDTFKTATVSGEVFN